MSRRRKSSDTTPFDTLRLEGSLFVPELLERAAIGEAAFQKEADYAIPKGLKLHDEYGRAFRIATASWQAFAPQMVRADVGAATVTRAFVIDLLRQCLGYTDLTLCPAPLDANGEPRVANGGEPARRESSAPPSSFNLHPSTFRFFPVTAQASGGRLPVIIAPHHLGVDDPDPRFAIHGSGLKRKSAHQLATNHSPVGASSEWGMASSEDASSSAHSPLATNHSPVGASSEWGVANGEDVHDSSSSSHSPLATHHSPVGASSEQRMASSEDASSSAIQNPKSKIQNSSALTRAFPTPRHAVSYIMDTFPIVKRKDIAKHGTYRTKETILQIYDALGESMQTGVAYQTLLDPPPADPACCHPARPSLPDV